MKICFLVQDSPAIYGAERATLDLAAGLSTRPGLEVTFLLIGEARRGLAQSAWRSELDAAAMVYTVVPTSRAFSPALAASIRAALREQGANVVQTVGYKAAVHAWLALRGVEGIKWVATVHGWLFRSDPKERLYGWLEAKALKRCDRVIVLSRHYQKMLTDKGISQECLVRIPSGLDASEVAGTTGQGRLPGCPPLVVGMLGRLSSEKRHHHFFEEARNLLDQGVDARFLVAGDGPERVRLEEQVRSLGLGDRVEMTGYLDQEHFFRQIHLLTLCSTMENLPYSIMEAMAWSRPVVAHAVGGIPDLVVDGETGLLVDPHGAGGLAEAWAQLAGNPGLLEKMGKAGRDRLEKNFSREGQLAAHQELYRSLLA